VKVEQANTESRPYAYADPRSLSQAWYDALYGPSAAHPHARPRGDPNVASRPEDADAPAAQSSPASDGRTGASDDPIVRRELARAVRSSGGSLEREAGVANARRRGAARSAEPPAEREERTDIDVAGPDGQTTRLHFRSGRSGLEVVAVAAPEMLDAIAEALTQASIALAARGIRLSHEIRVRGRS
jgi:hypothetical protein